MKFHIFIILVFFLVLFNIIGKYPNLKKIIDKFSLSPNAYIK